ncbi:unnamed protein product [Arctia plantaginis]|uniref:Uncharacterized protein n=1 Tax=Arctia plantaginis TaxID=874455 RepID=A0A8S0ZXC2_ARCPL|nr:unnamed protein product [Arctia plantaginis]
MSEVTHSISERRVKRDDSHSAITEPNKNLTNLVHEQQRNLIKNRRIYKHITDDTSMSYLKVIEDEDKAVTDDDFNEIVEDYDGEIDLRLGAEKENDNTNKNKTAETKTPTSKTTSVITRRPNITKPTFTITKSILASTGTNRRDVETPYFNSKLLQRYKDRLSVYKQKARDQEATEITDKQEIITKRQDNTKTAIIFKNNTIDSTEKNSLIFYENMYSELEELF